MLSEDSKYLWSVRFSEDGRYIASGEKKIRIFNVRTGKCIAGHPGHNDIVWSLVFTPDGNGLLTGSWDKRVIHWDVSWLELTQWNNTDGQKKDISRQDMMEISRFVGHEVRLLSRPFLTLQQPSDIL